MDQRDENRAMASCPTMSVAHCREDNADEKVYKNPKEGTNPLRIRSANRRLSQGDVPDRTGYDVHFSSPGRPTDQGKTCEHYYKVVPQGNGKNLFYQCKTMLASKQCKTAASPCTPGLIEPLKPVKPAENAGPLETLARGLLPLAEAKREASA